MSEAVFRVLQLGHQAGFGTAVAATTIFPVDPGSGEFELDRAAESPDEDYGVIARHQAGRGSFGVRIATGSVTGTVRYEDFGHILNMALNDVSSSGTGTGTVTHTWTNAMTAIGVIPYTLEVSDDTQDWDVDDVVCTQFDAGFDALTAPGNAMWTFNASLQGSDKEKSTATASLTAPTALETVEGHLTTLSEGPVGTAFDSLTALTAHLVSYRITCNVPKPGRVYGGSSDKAASWGVQKSEITFEAELKVSSSSITDVFDIFNVSGGLPTDRRWRISCDGAGVNAMTIDGRVRFTSVNVNPDGRDGERLLAVSGYYVYDSTLASDLQWKIVNANDALA